MLVCDIGNLICNILGPSFDPIVSIIGNTSTMLELHKLKRETPFERERERKGLEFFFVWREIWRWKVQGRLVFIRREFC